MANKFFALLTVGILCLSQVTLAHAARKSSTLSGVASIYSYVSEKTANGERTVPGALTAAHKSLPFGTIVKVTNNENGRSITVRINDRGPFVRGRVIDLTPAGGKALGFDGLASVSLDIVSR